MECSSIAEFGVRGVVSTWAFMKGLKDSPAQTKKMICVDLTRSPNVARAESAASQNSIHACFFHYSLLLFHRFFF
jgi:hypothetical protein